MAGSKRNRVKKMLSPTRAITPPPPTDNAADDDGLMDDLLTQLDSRDGTVQKESATVLNEMNIQEVADDRSAASKQDSKARHKARQARKAAALAEKYAPVDAEADAKLEKEAREEERIINATCEELGVKMFEINPDGHCLFSAVADQLVVLNIVSDATYATVRLAAGNYMETHPDDFLPFLPSAENSDSGIMSPLEYKSYCASIRSTAVWGGEHEILALSRAYNVPIHVIQAAAPNIVPHNPSDKPPPADSKVLRISYHRRMYGLGEHYNSLRPKRSLTDVLKMTFSSSPP